MGTIVNVATVVVGALLGIALGNRIPERTKETVTSVLGLFTVVIGGLSVVSMNSSALADEHAHPRWRARRPERRGRALVCSST